jgi:hypothetical protein
VPLKDGQPICFRRGPQAQQNHADGGDETAIDQFAKVLIGSQDYPPLIDGQPQQSLVGHSGSDEFRVQAVVAGLPEKVADCPADVRIG